MTLAALRNAALANTADTSNPLTIEHSAAARLNRKSSEALYDEAIRAGFRTFRGQSARAPLSLGSVPVTTIAEELEITHSGVKYSRVELTAAGMAAA